MKWRIVCAASLAIAVVAIAAYSVAQVARGPAKARTPGQLAFQLQLQPDEILWQSAAGALSDSLQPALVFGTLLHLRGSRIHVLHWQGEHYEEVWTFTHPFADEIREVIIRDVNNDHRDDLVTLWRSGSGGYLDVVIFEWNGRTYKEIWDLDRHVKEGQLTECASLLIRRLDSFGNIALMVRTPLSPDENPCLGAHPHQVSIYRWDARKQTFVLFKRSVDPSTTYE